MLIEAVLFSLNCLNILWDKERGEVCSGWQPEQPLRNPIIHYCTPSFPCIILIMPHSSRLLGPPGIRAKQQKHQEGDTEGTATTARHTLHNKSKAISCIPTLAILTKGSGTPEMHGNLRNEEDREHFPLDAIKPTNQGWNFTCKLSALINHGWTAWEIHKRKRRVCRKQGIHNLLITCHLLLLQRQLKKVCKKSKECTSRTMG